MNITLDEGNRLWRAMASYIEECQKLVTINDEPDVKEFYINEIEASKILRNKLKCSIKDMC